MQKQPTSAPDSGRGPTIRTCPIDLHPLPPVPPATSEEIAAAVNRARAAQEGWRGLLHKQRVAALRKAARTMLARRGEIIALVRDEIGKLEIEGLFNEGLGPLNTLNAWAGVVGRATRRQRVRLSPLAFPGKSAFIDQVPRGVIGVIAPWNFPVAGLYRSLFPALLTGNGVVLKPSEHSPRSSEWLATLLGAELPEGLISVVHGDGAAGAALIDAGIDACVFTGSPAGGRAVRLSCAERGIPCSVEMGGKDAAIVFADCHLDRTIAGITHWALSNVGQSCGALEVALVERGIAYTVVERLRSAFTRLRVGPAEYADISPLGNQRQFDVVRAHVADARARGATVVCGGEPTGQGLFFPPTLLDHCTEEMAAVRDETFGPLLAVVRIDSEDEAVRHINRGRYGLGASIWTADLARAERIAARLDVGLVDVNNHSFTGAIPELPWSGTRETGFGIANSAFSLSTFVRPRALVIDRSSGPEPFWMPFDRTLFEMGEVLSEVQLMHLGGAWKLPGLMSRRRRTIKTFFRG